MNPLLRPARRVTAAGRAGRTAVGGVLGAVAVTALLSAGSATAVTPGGPAPAGGTGTAASTPAAVVPAAPALTTQGYETKVLAGINRVRARHHLRAVTTASCAERVATRWSVHLAATDGFEHQSMQKLLKTCDARYVGEVLGRGSISPNRLVRMWLDSPPHRRILLSGQPRRIGIGATANSRGEWVVAANFMTF